MAENESPFIEEGEKTEKPAGEEKIDIEALTAKLEQFDIKDPQQLEGKLRNANAYSNVQSERDVLANELHQLRAEMQNLQKPQASQETLNDDYMETGQPVDIESIVAKAVRNELTAAQRASHAQMARENEMYMKITTHPKFHLIEKEWNEAVRDPVTNMNLRSGKIDAMDHFYGLLISKYEGVTKETVKAFKQMQGTTSVEPPHVESGARSPQMSKDERSKRDKKLDELRAQRDKNPLGLTHDDQQDDFIDLALGDIL